MADELLWFPFYVHRFMGSRRVQRMTAEEVGGYILLLIDEWNNGPVPADDAPRISRLPDAVAMRLLCDCFTETDAGWINEPLEDIRAEQESRAHKLKTAASVGAKARWAQRKNANRNAAAMQPQCDGNAIREEKRREEKKKTADSNARTHAEFSTWMGEHARALFALDYYAQAAVWGLWGPSGVQAHDWKGMGEERQKPILAAAIMTYASEGKRGFMRPFFAKILASAIRDAIASDHEGETRSTEEREAAELRTAAKAMEAAEIARLNAAAAKAGGTVSIPAGSKRGGEPGRVHVEIGG